MMVAVDTNVLVRLLVNDDARQARRARALFEREEIFISPTVLLESEWVLRSAYGLAPACSPPPASHADGCALTSQLGSRANRSLRQHGRQRHPDASAGTHHLLRRAGRARYASARPMRIFCTSDVPS